MREGRFAALLCAALALAALPRAGAAETAVSVRPVPAAWETDIAAPVAVDAVSGEGGTLRLAFISGSRRQTRSVTLEPGKPARIETPLYAGFNGRMEWTLGEEGGSASVGWPSRRNAAPPPIVAVDAFLLRELEAAAQGLGTDRTLSSVPARDLPADWQSYAGLRAVIVLDAAGAEALSPAQSRALAMWVRWFGGVLWLAADPGEQARALGRVGLPLENAAVLPRPFGRDAFFLNGRVRLPERVSAADAAAYAVLDEAEPAGLLRPREVGGGEDLLSGLGEIPASFIIASLLLLGVFLGPVALAVVRRKKNPLLFFVLVPAAALLGAAGIVAGAVCIEGAGGEYNRTAILARRAGSDDAVLFDRRGVRPGILVPEARFGAETLALPFAGFRRMENVTMDVTDGLRPGAGWLLPRFATGFLTLRPVVCRMHIEVRPAGREGGGHAVVNNLGFTAVRVAARLPDGGVGWAENVPPGGTALLAPERGTRRYEELCRLLAEANGGVPPAGNVLLVAETDGLPYLEDGGIGGTLRKGRFFHVVGGNRDGSGGEEGADNAE